MWLILQQDAPDDFIMATGVDTSVRQFALSAFARAGIPLIFRGSGEDECGYHAETGACLIEVDPAYFRPTEVNMLVGDSSKARRQLGWEPKVGLDELCAMMVDADLADARTERAARRDATQ
jgi:GDPmannose 4,6-dehydratase